MRILRACERIRPCATQDLHCCVIWRTYENGAGGRDGTGLVWSGDNSQGVNEGSKKTRSPLKMNRLCSKMALGFSAWNGFHCWKRVSQLATGRRQLATLNQQLSPCTNCSSGNMHCTLCAGRFCRPGRYYSSAQLQGSISIIMP